MNHPPARRHYLAVLLTAIFACLQLPVTHAQTRKPPTPRDLKRVPTKSQPAVAALPVSSKRWALLIGIDQYRDSQITPLKGAANDARLLAAALTQYAGFPAEQVFTLASNEPAERQPTRANIIDLLDRLKDSVPADGLLLFAFSGHGLERNGQAFLIPADARFKDDLTYLREAAISVNSVRDMIQSSNVAQKIILLDHCRSDPAAARAEAPNLMTAPWKSAFNFQVRNAGVEAFCTLYATGVGQRAYEINETPNKDQPAQGYFTQAVIEALSGKAANDKGEVTLSALLRYVQTEVPQRVSRALGAARKQTPFADMKGYLSNDLVIAAIAPKPVVAVVKEPEPVRPVVDPQLIELERNASERVFWESIKNSTDVADFEDYLQRYTNGRFATIAKRKIDALRKVAEAKSREVAPPAPVRPALPLRSFTFTTATVDEEGEITHSTKQAEEFVVDLGNKVTLELVRIPAGHFMMGSPPEELGHHTNEEPLHEVNVREFLLGKYEVTREQWREVAKSPKVKIELKPDPSKFRDDWKQPVQQISWYEAVEFCERLSRKIGKEVRLPSEAEWEYAARAGTTTRFYFGDVFNSQLISPIGKVDRTNVVSISTWVKVGSTNIANGFGLFDMLGSVSEWNQDMWHYGYVGAPNDGSQWVSSEATTNRAIRGDGGIRGRDFYRLRSASRHMSDAAVKVFDQGMRVAITLNTP